VSTRPTRGILLAGGTGSRLRPATFAVSKQLLPVFDKPMVYYPLTALMLAGVREILVVTAAGEADRFRRLLGDGTRLGLSLRYLEQPAPEGIAQALVLGRGFLDGAPVMLALGDNLLYGGGLTGPLQDMARAPRGARVFGYRVSDPHRYGVLVFDGERVVDIVEKPEAPVSRWAVPGLYAYGPDAPDRAAALVPSARGELEITDLHRAYLADGQLQVTRLGRGHAWLDMGTPERLHAASGFVAAMQERQAQLIGSPEEVAWRQGWIDDAALLRAAKAHVGTTYGQMLAALVEGDR